ncbi:hypothetical protein [Pedobacter aquatilis]|uniref:hypothetical protein n=1 Tax=Pedobacter aquatilis TaxID=351343 RepID=UPI00292DD3F5|nr:hypothetical protein [Pedobacter aquatilis]
MKNLDGLTAGLDIARQLNKNLVANTAIMGIVHAQNEFNRKMRPYYGALDSIIKTTNLMNGYRPELTGILGFAQAIHRNAFSDIPLQTITAIDLIAKQHRSLFANASAITSTMTSVVGITQLNSLQMALNSVAGNIARIAASTNKWELIEDFEAVSEQAVELSDNLLEDFQLSDETTRAFNSLVDLVVAFLKKNRRAGIYSLIFIDMVLRVASIHQYYDFLKTKPEIATKEDVKKLETKLLKSIEEKLKDHKEYRITSLNSQILLKPRSKSTVLCILPKNS